MGTDYIFEKSDDHVSFTENDYVTLRKEIGTTMNSKCAFHALLLRIFSIAFGD